MLFLRDCRYTQDAFYENERLQTFANNATTFILLVCSRLTRANSEIVYKCQIITIQKGRFTFWDDPDIGIDWGLTVNPF